MTCRVVKIIKGHPYLYEQTSYRVNGKVKTESRYLGALDINESLEIILVTQEEVVKITHNMGETIQPVSHQEKPTEAKNTPPSVQEKTHKSPKSTPLTLQIKANFKTHKISESATHSQYTRYNDFLQRKGIKSEHIPSLIIKSGSIVNIYKNSFGKGYRVTLPKQTQKGTRSKFWNHFHKVQAYTYLDGLE